MASLGLLSLETTVAYEIWSTCALVPGLSRAECAAWVQAWGSIGAIMATGFGVYWAHRLQVQREREQRKAERIDRLEVLYKLIDSTVNSVANKHHKLRDKSMVDAVRAGRVQVDIGLLKSLHVLLAPVPLHDLDDPDVAFEILVLTDTARQFGKAAFEVIRGIGMNDVHLARALATLQEIRTAAEKCRSNVRSKIDGIKSAPAL